MKLPINYDKCNWRERKAARDQYAITQSGICFYCGEPLKGKPNEKVLSLPIRRELFPPNFFKWPVHLHHNHETGTTIGAVHAHCNAVLWQYEKE